MAGATPDAMEVPGLWVRVVDARPDSSLPALWLPREWGVMDSQMPQYLTLPELCEWLRVKPATVYEWTHTGFIPHLKLGRLLRFERGTIAAWLADQERAGRPTKMVPLKKISSSAHFPP